MTWWRKTPKLPYRVGTLVRNSESAYADLAHLAALLRDWSDSVDEHYGIKNPIVAFVCRLLGIGASQTVVATKVATLLEVADHCDRIRLETLADAARNKEDELG